jgi:Ni/Co efflux regulator RcnB
MLDICEYIQYRLISSHSTFFLVTVAVVVSLSAAGQEAIEQQRATQQLHHQHQHQPRRHTHPPALTSTSRTQGGVGRGQYMLGESEGWGKGKNIESKDQQYERETILDSPPPHFRINW